MRRRSSAGKRFDLADQVRPFRLRQLVQLRRQPAQHLRQLKDQKGPLLDADAVRAAWRPWPQQLAAARRSEPAISQCFAGDVRDGQAIQQQPDRQELDQAAFRRSDARRGRRESRLAWTMPAQPRRASSVAERNASHSVLGDAEQIQRLHDRSSGSTPSRSSAQISAATRAASGPAALPAGGTSRRNDAQKPCVAFGQRPVREALIEKRRAEADQRRRGPADRCPRRVASSSRSRCRDSATRGAAAAS